MITAAAAIMISVFLAFVLADQVFLKMMGVGLATAIFVDATIVRMVLVPGDDGAARRRQLVAAEVARPPAAARSTSRASPTASIEAELAELHHAESEGLGTRRS